MQARVLKEPGVTHTVGLISFLLQL